MIQNSNKILDRIGYCQQPIFFIQNNSVKIDSDSPKYEFTPKEFKLLKILFENKNRVCDFYKISSELWENLNKFSLWAVNK